MEMLMLILSARFLLIFRYVYMVFYIYMFIYRLRGVEIKLDFSVYDRRLFGCPSSIFYHSYFLLFRPLWPRIRDWAGSIPYSPVLFSNPFFCRPVWSLKV